MTKRNVLVTGFAPFGGHAGNPSQEIARALEGRVIAGRRVVGAILPCAFGASRKELRRLLERHRPELVIACGLADARNEITPERVALNLDDARIPDNAGAQPVDRPIIRAAPAAYWSTLPLKAIVAALRARAVPASVSQTAGTFVCNHVFFGLMHALQHRRGMRGGFIHVPWPSESLTIETMTAAIATAVEVSLRRVRDVRIPGGKTS